VLLSFRVGNHKSIRDEQTLHMQPVYDKTRPAVPIAAIFGANAAGKSNVLDALSFMVGAVRDSFGSWREAIPRSPFRLCNDGEDRASTFVVELLLDGVRWVYGFVIDSRTVREEWLYTYPQHRRRIVFERHATTVRFGTTTSTSTSSILAGLASLSEYALLLSVGGLLEQRDFGAIWRWFDSAVMLMPAGAENVDERTIVERLRGEDSRRLAQLLMAADVGIRDVKVEDLYAHPATSNPEQNTPIESRLAFVHGRHQARLGLADQSKGTRVWLGYLGHVLEALDRGSLLVVDEIDTSLHPHLTAQLVRLFREPEVNPLGAQLVFTTHDATLLGKYFGDRILARDEVWFVEKNADQETQLYSLAEFKARQEDNVERRYLTGAYGAIPQPGEYRFDDAVRDQPA
jgi:uncharacterized protein